MIPKRLSTPELEALCVQIFESEWLHPESCGHVLLCCRGKDTMEVTTGFVAGKGWEMILAADGSVEYWPESDVFSPHDAMKLQSVSMGLGLPVGSHEDVEEQAKRIAGSMA